MSPSDSQHLLPAVQETLQAFLAERLGQDAPISWIAPEESSPQAAKQRAEGRAAVIGRAGEAASFAIVLDPGWIPLLAQAVGGEPVQAEDAGARDLLREAAARGYDAVRERLAAEGAPPPDVSFDVLLPDEPFPSEAFTGRLRAFAFEAKPDGHDLGGAAFLTAGSSEPGAQAAPQAQPGLDVAPASFPDLGVETRPGAGAVQGDGASERFELLAEVELEVTVELGRRRLLLADVLNLATGSVIELEKLVGEPLEVYANGRLIAEGEAVVIDEQFGVRITRLAATRQRSRALL